MRRISTIRILADIDRVAIRLERAPTSSEYEEFGKYSYVTVVNRFGNNSWAVTMKQLGYEPTTKSDKTSANLLRSDFERVVEKVGGTPTKAEYYKFGEYSPYTIATRFGDGLWSAAVEELGYEPLPARGEKRVSDEELQADFDSVASELGRAPTSSEYGIKGEYSNNTVANRFGDGSWGSAVRELGYFYIPGGPEKASEEVLQADFNRVVTKLGRPPTVGEYNEHGHLGAETITDRFACNWGHAVEELGHDPDSMKLTDEEVRADYERVNEEGYREPTLGDYHRRGLYSSYVVIQRCGDVFQSVGEDPSRQSPVAVGKWLSTIKELGSRFLSAGRGS